MEEDEDDLYAENDTAAPERGQDPPEDSNVEMEDSNGEMDEDDGDEEMDEDDEEEGSDSEIEIVTERKPGEEDSAPIVVSRTADATETTQVQQTVQSPTGEVTTTTTTTVVRPQAMLQSGRAYPEVRSSTVDVKANPIYPPLNKPIVEIEIDVDLVQHEKPWRRPGADQSDYFNYGFDEFTWSTYCLRQREVAEAIVDQRADNAKFEMMFGGGMMPGMPAAVQAPPAAAPPANGGAAAAMAAMGGGPMMPSEQDFQRMMLQAMEEQGTSDPNQLDFNAFMARLQGGVPVAPAGPTQQQQGQPGFGAGDWQRSGGAFGRGNGKGPRRW